MTGNDWIRRRNNYKCQFILVNSAYHGAYQARVILLLNNHYIQVSIFDLARLASVANEVTLQPISCVLVYYVLAALHSDRHGSNNQVSLQLLLCLLTAVQFSDNSKQQTFVLLFTAASEKPLPQFKQWRRDAIVLNQWDDAVWLLWPIGVFALLSRLRCDLTPTVKQLGWHITLLLCDLK